MSVSCMKSDNHAEGSKSIYVEKSVAPTIVTTNGTVDYKHENHLVTSDKTHSYVQEIDGMAVQH